MSRLIDVRRTGRSTRSGFSMIELLVVIGIIAFLITLSAAAAIRFMGGQRSSNTRTLLSRLKSRLAQQTAWVADQARKGTIPTVAVGVRPTLLNDVTTLASYDPDRAKVIHGKFLFLQWFPTTFAEALSSPGVNYNYPATTRYTKYLEQYGITPVTNPPGTPPQPYESAACLYMILRFGPETTGEDDLGLNTGTKAASALNLNPKPASSIPVMVDDWGNALIFCRWPIGNLTSNGGNTGYSPVNPQGALQASATQVYSDPLDPKGMLTVQSWLSSRNRTQFEKVIHPVPNRSNGKGQSLNLTPVIVSSGPDGQSGFFVPPKYTTQATTLEIQTTGQVSDNLYSNAP